MKNWEVTFCCPKVKQFFCCCFYRGHRNSGDQSLSLPEQLNFFVVFFDRILHNWLYHPAEKSNAIVSSAKGAVIWLKAVLVFNSAQGCVSIHPSVWFPIHSTFEFSRPCFLSEWFMHFPWGHSYQHPYCWVNPCILLLPLFLMWALQCSFLWQRQAVVFL